jgi:hypothetical protein
MEQTLFALYETDAVQGRCWYPPAILSAQRRVFVQERTARCCWRCNPMEVAPGQSIRNGIGLRMREHPNSDHSDASGSQHDFGWPCYQLAYAELRQRFVASGSVSAAERACGAG